MPDPIPKIANPYPSSPSSVKSGAYDESQPTPSANAGDIFDLIQRVTALEEKRVNLNTDVFGLFETVSAAPTGVPRDLYDQIKIYVNGGTYRLYVYDVTGRAWHYATLT